MVKKLHVASGSSNTSDEHLQLLTENNALLPFKYPHKSLCPEIYPVICDDMNSNHHIHITPYDFCFDASLLKSFFNLVEYRSQAIMLLLKFVRSFLPGELDFTKGQIWDVPKYSSEL